MNTILEFLKHLRSTHFALVVTCLVIAVGLSGQSEELNRAVDQLNDIIQSAEALQEDPILKQVQTQAGQLQSWQRDKTENIEQFLSDTVVEHFENIEIPVNEADIYAYEFGLRPEDSWLIDEFGPEEFSFFYTNGAVLSTGTEQLYYVDALGSVQTRSIDMMIASIDEQLAFETLYRDPLYDAYYNPGTLFSPDGSPIDAESLWEQLDAMNAPAFSASLEEIRFTTADSRLQYDNAELAASESPVVWEERDFLPDFMILKGRFLERDGERDPIAVTVHLPVMFDVEAAAFFSDVLRDQFQDQPYYARYITGARSFAELFPELYEATDGLRSLQPDDMRTYLTRKAGEGDTAVNVIGIEVGRELVEVWGILLLVGVYAYFALHLRTFLIRFSGAEVTPFPWVGIYRDGFSRVIFHGSLLLPLVVCILLARAQVDAAGGVRPATWLFFLACGGLFVWLQLALRSYPGPQVVTGSGDEGNKGQE